MREVLEKLVKGEITLAEAEKVIKSLTIREVGNLAKLDIGRECRRGVPEIVIAEGKTPEDVVEITKNMLSEKGRAIISRTGKSHVDAIREANLDNVILEENRKARTLVVRRKDCEVSKTGGKVGILTAGTSDIPIAEEAKVIAEEMGCETITSYDVGVAGIHRLFAPLRDMLEKDVDVIVVVAGREGALPSIVAGMVDIPLIAVPASMGYGLGGKGVSALMAMLQACPMGLAVVNIDGGIPAGTMAALIANRVARFRKTTHKRR